MDETRVGEVFPVGGPVAPEYVIGRTGEIDQLLARLTARRRSATRPAHVKPEAEVVRIEVPERRDADGEVFLQLIIDRCNTISRAATSRRVLRAARPAIESALRSAGVPLNLEELGAEPAQAATREILSLPLALAEQLGRPVIFFMDELQRAVDYTDGAEILQALVDTYSGVSDVVMLVDGSDERVLERMRGAPIQFDKLCDRLPIGPHIPKTVWREALPERFARLSMTITADALAAIVEFGAERPYDTMAAAQGAALAARRINIGSDRAEVGAFEADQGIASARRRLAEDV